MLRNIVRKLPALSIARNISANSCETSYETMGSFLLDNSPVKKKKVYDLIEANPYLRHVKAPPFLDIFKQFNFSHKDIGTALYSQPRIASVSHDHVTDILLLLSSLGYEDHELVKIVIKNPIILTLPKHDFLKKYEQIFELFTKKELKKIIKNNPEVFSLNIEEMEFKIKYLQFVMGIESKEIVMASAIAYPLEHIITRLELHIFSGVFKINNPKLKHKTNPKLEAMLRFTGSKLEKQCLLTKEEIETFTRISENELQDFDKPLNEDDEDEELSEEEDIARNMDRWFNNVLEMDDEGKLSDDIEGFEGSED